MPSAQEIIGFVKNLRGRRGDPLRPEPSFGAGPLKGKCLSSMEVADQFGGQHWRNDSIRDYSQQLHPGHSVAVIPTRGDAGVIVDFSNKEAVIIGNVSNIYDEGSVASALQQATGHAGWYNRDTVDERYRE